MRRFGGVTFRYLLYAGSPSIRRVNHQGISSLATPTASNIEGVVICDPQTLGYRPFPEHKQAGRVNYTSQLPSCCLRCSLHHKLRLQTRFAELAHILPALLPLFLGQVAAGARRVNAYPALGALVCYPAFFVILDLLDICRMQWA